MRQLLEADTVAHATVASTVAAEGDGAKVEGAEDPDVGSEAGSADKNALLPSLQDNQEVLGEDIETCRDKMQRDDVEMHHLLTALLQAQKHVLAKLGGGEGGE